MQGVKELKQKLGNLLNWHGSRLDFLAKFILSLIQVRTVNLAEIATAFPGNAKVDSHYKRLQRFFQNEEFSKRLFIFFQTCLIKCKNPRIAEKNKIINWLKSELKSCYVYL